MPFLDEILEEETNRLDVVVEVCGVPNVVNDGIRMLKPGGVYIFVGMVHPHSRLDITGEQIIRKCLTIKGRESSERCIDATSSLW